MFLQMKVNTIRLFSSAAIAIFTLTIAQGQTTPEKKVTRAEKIKERKAQADSLLQKAGISTPDLGVEQLWPGNP
jgi:hypothetical protein